MTALQPSTLRMWSQQCRKLLRSLSYGALCLALMHGLPFLLFTAPSYLCSARRVDRAWLDIRNIGQALKLSWARTGRYPTTEEGLRALVERQALESVPRDPWGNEYHYLLWLGCPVVWSYGGDGAPGGEGQDTDLSTMGSPPPQWILQQAALSAPRPAPRYCPWSEERGAPR
jgi:Type II secretion system (T2SS), protein G